MEEIINSSKNIIIGCTGSVAAIKVPDIAAQLKSIGYSVMIVPTEKALHFLKCQATTDRRTLMYISCKHQKDPPCLECEVKGYYSELTFVTDKDEWDGWQKRGDPVKHIDLVKWASVLLLSPLDANTLGKVSNGICDNMLTCIVRAWDIQKPLLFCLAMNTKMYLHPLTKRQSSILKEFGYKEISATSKKLMCGDTGIGGMAEVETIVKVVISYIENLLKEKNQ